MFLLNSFTVFFKIFTIFYIFLHNFIKKFMSWFKNRDQKWWLKILSGQKVEEIFYRDQNKNSIYL